MATPPINPIRNLPLFLLVMGVFSASMLVPATYALTLEAFHEARSFFYAALIGLLFVAMIGITRNGLGRNATSMTHLQALFGCFVVLPLMLAVPFYESIGTTTFLSAYFEMVSCLTTTGLSLFDSGRLSNAEHLWRAQVAWMGGAIIWVAAAAILAPLSLGGFEVTSRGQPGQPGDLSGQGLEKADQNTRLYRAIRALLPIYAGLTAALAAMLVLLGHSGLDAVIFAMSTMSTSGVTAHGAVLTDMGIADEAVICCFLMFGLSRLTFAGDTKAAKSAGITADPEFRTGLMIVCSVPIVLMLRQWLGAIEIGEPPTLLAFLRGFWGAFFTAMSFLTTTGFVSGDWGGVQSWSGLNTPDLILMGLAVMGGGVATTAGGVKLLRVVALYLNGRREVEKLVHPSQVVSVGRSGTRIGRDGIFIAWVFFMMFALTISAICLVLGLVGIDFEPAMVLAVASLTNTGPLIEMTSSGVDLIALAWGGKLILCASMVLGRLEILAIVVLFTPEIWTQFWGK